MPLVYVQTYRISTTSGGTQYITGASPGLHFTGPTVIELDPTTFTEKSTYVLFDYSAGAFTYTGYASGQAALDALVTVDVSALDIYGITTATLTDEPANYRIIVTLS